jgi:NYN domain
VVDGAVRADVVRMCRYVNGEQVNSARRRACRVSTSVEWWLRDLVPSFSVRTALYGVSAVVDRSGTLPFTSPFTALGRPLAAPSATLGTQVKPEPRGPRVAVFVDFENARLGAAAAFQDRGPRRRVGLFDPVVLAEHLVGLGQYRRRLSAINIYRGMPDVLRERDAFVAAQRHAREWSNAGARVAAFPLRYPTAWPVGRPVEKCVDVALAVDLVLQAERRMFDVAIVMSSDHDLVPALVEVIKMSGVGAPRIEVAAWQGKGSTRQRLSVPGQRIWCHWVGEEVFRAATARRDMPSVRRQRDG